MKDERKTRQQLVEELAELRRRIVALEMSEIERQQAEEALRRSQLQYQTLAEHAPVGIWHAEPDGSGVYINPKLIEITGLAPETALGRGWASALYPDDRKRVFQEWVAFVQREAPYHSTYRFQHPDGTVRWVIGQAVPSRTPDGELLGFTGTLTDITERKRVEEALRESEAKMRSIFRAAPIGIGVVSNRVILDVNDRFCEITGYARDELVGKKARMVYPTDEEYEYVGREKYAQIQERGTGTVETRFKRKDGEIIDVLLSSSPLDPTDFSAGVTFSALDITKRKRVEEALQKAHNNLEERVRERTRELRETQGQLLRQEKLAILGKLAEGMAHELRHPLGVLSNAAYFLNATLSGTGEITGEYLDIISTQVREAQNIISDLLDFTHPQPANREAVTVTALVAPVLEECPPPATVQVITQITDDLPPVYVDPGQMEQVLVNLVTNAYQAMPDGGELAIKATSLSRESGRPALSIVEGAGEGVVSISVTDTGSGILPENKGKIFEPLFTTRARGMGLGLAITKILVEGQGGTIEVESEAGQGSTFTVKLSVQGKESH
jgi:PAS domain S-box-containing protein